MVVTDPTSLFDLYYVFVDVLFGSIWLSYLGLIMIFSLIGFLCRMSPWTLGYILYLFSFVFLTAYFGAFALLPLTVIGLVWSGWQIIRLIGGYTQIGTVSG